MRTARHKRQTNQCLAAAASVCGNFSVSRNLGGNNDGRGNSRQKHQSSVLDQADLSLAHGCAVSAIAWIPSHRSNRGEMDLLGRSMGEVSDRPIVSVNGGIVITRDGSKATGDSRSLVRSRRGCSGWLGDPVVTSVHEPSSAPGSTTSWFVSPCCFCKK